MHDRTNCAAKRHGDYAAYRNFHCRCPDAREDWRLYNKRRRQGRHQPLVIDGTGTRRRLQALVAIGWPGPAIAERIGFDQAMVMRLYHASRVNVATATAVRELYRQLSDTPGPSWRSPHRAAANGWVPPIAWDDDTIDDPEVSPSLGSPADDIVDEVAVARVHAGQLPFGDLTRAEQVELFRRFRDAGGRGTLCLRWNINLATYRRLENAAAKVDEVAA